MSKSKQNKALMVESVYSDRGIYKVERIQERHCVENSENAFYLSRTLENDKEFSR